MSNGPRAWECARCGTGNLARSGLCARCGAPRGTPALRDGATRETRRGLVRGSPGGEVARAGSPAFAAGLSALLPGLGQLYAGRWRRGLVMPILPLLALALVAALVAWSDPLTSLVLRHATAATLAVIGALLSYHLFAVGDAFAGRPHAWRGRRATDYVVLGVVSLALITGYATLYRQSAPWAAVAARLFAPFSDRVTAPGSADGAVPAWSGTERLNVLILGVDTRDSDPSTQNTDTMMILSIDPLNKTAAMLSIPRDIFVSKPGTYQGKINGAFGFGGARLAERLVTDLTGVAISSYTIVNFDAFTTIINGVGGVMIDVRRPLRDEAYPTEDYGVERLDIVAGPRLMYGQTALAYARSRHDTNDYSRAMRQQLVIGALRTKLAQPDAFRTIPALVDGVGTTIETDLDPANTLPLARAATGLASSDIRSDVLYPCGGGYPHCELTVSLEGGFYLIPNAARVRDFAAAMFYDPRIRQEAARIAVQNSGARAGTAADVADRLARRAYGITGVSDAPAAPSAIVLHDAAKRYTADQLRQVLGNIPIETASSDASGPDIVVRIGSDFRGFATDLAR